MFSLGQTLSFTKRKGSGAIKVPVINKTLRGCIDSTKVEANNASLVSCPACPEFIEGPKQEKA